MQANDYRSCTGAISFSPLPLGRRAADLQRPMCLLPYTQPEFRTSASPRCLMHFTHQAAGLQGSEESPALPYDLVGLFPWVLALSGMKVVMIISIFLSLMAFPVSEPSFSQL